MRRIFFTVMLFVFVSCKTKDVEVAQKNPGAGISTEVMTARIAEAAVKFSASDTSVYAEYDLGMGRTYDEFKKMNSLGIMFLTALAKDKNELPLKHVYFRSANGDEFEFPVLFQKDVPVTDERIIKTFGKNRRDYYLLVPSLFLYVKGQILIDWNGSRTSFRLAETPNPYSFGFNISSEDLTPETEKLNTDIFMKYLIEEYDIKANEKSEFIKSLNAVE
ncbi:MAG: hypothetical protein JW982_12345 [Spirochaetes bacterium]|nr:hypothetical protein [Spirochaetota bacterium]